MKRLILAAALLATPVSGQPQDAPQPTIEQKTLLRCSAMFAIVAAEQKAGVKTALAYPPLGERGQEYFVRAAAQIMDQLGITRQQVADLMWREMDSIKADEAKSPNRLEIVDRIMQPCLLSLIASGL